MRWGLAFLVGVFLMLVMFGLIVYVSPSQGGSITSPVEIPGHNAFLYAHQVWLWGGAVASVVLTGVSLQRLLAGADELDGREYWDGNVLRYRPKGARKGKDGES